MKDNLSQDEPRLVVEDVQFETLPAGSTSVKLLPVLAVTVFFVGIYIAD